MRPATLNDNVWTQTVPQKDYYTVQDVQVILDVGGPSVYGAIKRGTLRGVTVNGVVHVRHEALIAYMSRKSQAPVFDPSQLVIEDIVPEKEAAKAASTMLPDDEDEDFLDDDNFLDE